MIKILINKYFNKFYKYCSLQEIFTLIRFGIVGIIATLVHIFSAWILLDNLQINNAIIANTIAFLIAFIFSFLGHYFWTFKANKDNINIRKSIIKFFIIAVTGFSINTFLLSILLYFNIVADEKFAIIIALIFVPIFTYILSKFWGFKSNTK